MQYISGNQLNVVDLTSVTQDGIKGYEGQLFQTTGACFFFFFKIYFYDRARKSMLLVRKEFFLFLFLLKEIKMISSIESLCRGSPHGPLK